MRWLAGTLGLLAASVALVVGIYVRDRDSHWLPPQRKMAAYDARTMLLQLPCGHVCSYTLLANPHPDHWLVRVEDGIATECFDIDVVQFETTTARGVSGVTTVACGAARD
jgi:hypothetical protein